MRHSSDLLPLRNIRRKIRASIVRWEQKNAGAYQTIHVRGLLRISQLCDVKLRTVLKKNLFIMFMLAYFLIKVWSVLNLPTIPHRQVDTSFIHTWWKILRIWRNDLRLIRAFAVWMVRILTITINWILDILCQIQKYKFICSFNKWINL